VSRRFVIRPTYDDDVTGFSVSAPYGSLVDVPEEVLGVPVHNPSHPSFPPSSVLIPISAVPSLSVGLEDPSLLLQPVVSFPGPVVPASTEVVTRVTEDSEVILPRRSLRTSTRHPQPSVPSPQTGGGSHRHCPVGKRWFYEPVGPATTTEILLACPLPVEGLDGVDSSVGDPDVTPTTSSSMALANPGASA
jgi:hypothetical protein